MAKNILISTRNPQKGNFNCYYLPKGMLHLKLSQTSLGDPNASPPTPPEFSLEHDIQIMPDPANRWYLRYHTNGTSNNNITVGFTEEGYLSAINMVVEDTTVEIVQNVLDTVKTAVTGVADRSLAQPIVLYEATIDPFDPKALSNAIATIQQADKEFTMTFKPYSQPAAQPLDPDGDHDGFLCKPMELAELSYTLGGTMKQYVVKLPHPDISHLVAVPYAPMVKNTLDITFGPYGYPNQIKLEQPSWLLAASKLPGKVLSGLIEIPAQFLRLRINYDNSMSTNLADLENAKKSLRETQEQIKTANEARIAAEEAANKSEEG